MRVFTAALATETNTFSPMPTDRTLFEETFYAPAGTHGPKPEFFSGQTFAARKRAASSNWDVVEGLHTFAMPAGKTVKAIYEEYRDRILSELKAALPVDIVALGLHGAMVADGYDDCEGDLLERVRALVGPKVAVGIEIDPHCHMTEKMVKNADAIVIFKEYPHTDFMERGEELIDLLAKTARGEAKPRMSLYDCKMLAFLRTTREPVRGFVDKIQAMEGKDGILSISIVHGFPYGDVADIGTKVLVITDDRKAHGDRVAKALGQELWEKRTDLQPDLLTIDQAIDQALASPDSPVTIADPADNAGGGAPSDSTFFFRALQKRGVRNAAIAPMWDPGAVKLCFAAGLGGELDLRFGGKLGPTSGDPVDAHVKVIGLARNARQRFGATEFDLGDVAGIEVDGIALTLTTARVQALHPDVFSVAGIDPTKRKILVAKSTNHFYAGFATISKTILYSDGPGALAGDFRQIPFTKRGRKMWPFDADPWSD